MRGQSENAGHDQVDRDDVIEHSGNDQNQYSGYQRNDRCDGEVYVHNGIWVLLLRRLEESLFQNCLAMKVIDWSLQALRQQGVVTRAHRLLARLRELLRDDSACSGGEAFFLARGAKVVDSSLVITGVLKLVVPREGELFEDDNWADASADIVVSITLIIATTTSAKNNPTSLIKCLAAKRRVMCSAPVEILSATTFPAIIARRVTLSDVAYIPIKTVFEPRK